MLVRYHMSHQEWELLKWLTLLAVAAALTLAWAARIAGGAELRIPVQEPAPLPSKIEDWASPMGNYSFDKPTESRDVAMEVWEAIDLQFDERFDDAIAAWLQVEMPRETEVWKQVALGHAYLATGEIEKAAESLAAARTLDSENAIVSYAFGLLRLVQARVAEEWYDIQPNDGTVFTALTPYDVVPNTKSMYKLAAITELEAAIERSDTVPMDKALVPADWPTLAVMVPTVHDLLLATAANNFVARSHGMLGSLYLESGSLARAEQHMDKAVAGGLDMLDGYREVAEAYEAEELHADAMRAYLKASQLDPNKMPSLRKAWENFRKAILF